MTRCWFSCAATALSSSFERNVRLEMGLKLLGSSGSRPGFLMDVEEEDFLDRQLLDDKEVESDPPSSLARFVFLCLCVRTSICSSIA